MPYFNGFCKFSRVKPILIYSLLLVFSTTAFFAADVATLEANAQKGDPSAEFELGRAYLKGDGVAKDEKRAFELMSAAAAQGHVEAEAGLGYLLLTGTGTPKDEEKARLALEVAAKQGSAKAAYNLGKLLSDKNEVPEAIPRLAQSAEAGLLEAELLLADWYYFGREGVPKDYTKAFPLYLKAADQGSAQAQNTVGYMLFSGVGIEMDRSRGAEYYKKAADQGLPKAQVNLAYVYLSTEIFGKNPVECLRLLFIANSKGEVTAKNMLNSILPGQKPEDIALAAKLSGVKFGNPETYDLEGAIMPPPRP
jgi:TPR repeat protein